MLSPSYSVAPMDHQMVFRNSFNLEEESPTVGRDGMVLEISINGGAFQDILAAGGNFVSGGYTGRILFTDGPLVGRPAWTGVSGPANSARR